jgi:hypothetical protein
MRPPRRRRPATSPPRATAGFRAVDPLVGLDDPTKPVRSKFLAVPALRERYLDYVHDIAERWMDWKTLGPLAERYQALIADAVAADTRKLYGTEEFTTALNGSGDSLKAFLDLRRAYLLRADTAAD